MIPVKLVETIFRRYWALLIPLILVPAIALALTSKQWDYQSTAVVWVSEPVGAEPPAIGSNSPYLTPAQNQARTLNDLLSTDSFLTLVYTRAGLVSESTDTTRAASSVSGVQISAYGSGVNLLTISAISNSPEASQALVQAVIDEYLARATVEIERDSSVSAEYYSQQLAVAQLGLQQRNSQISEYLAAHPKAIDPTNIESQSLEYRTLREQAENQSRLVSRLEDSLQAVQLRVASAPQTQASLFTVQDSPSEPTAPLPVSLTSRAGVPMAAAVLGLMIGLGYIYFAYRTDHTIRSAEDLQGVDIPLLGSVPQLEASPVWARYTPIAWFITWRRRDFARKTAAAISAPAPSLNVATQTEAK